MNIQSEIEAAERQRQDNLEWEAYRLESIEKRAIQAAEQEINRRNSPTPAPYGIVKESPVLTVEAREAIYKKHEHNEAIKLKPLFDNPENKEKFIEKTTTEKRGRISSRTTERPTTGKSNTNPTNRHRQSRKNATITSFNSG